MGTNAILIETLELLLEDWRHEINRVYAKREDETDPTIFNMHDRELNRRLHGIHKFETLIKQLKG